MGRLTTPARNALPNDKFAGPNRTYPVPNKSHAVDAKARASAAEKAGRITPAAEKKIDSKANAVIKKGK